MELLKSRTIKTHWDCNKSYEVENIFTDDGCPYCENKLGGYNIEYLDPSCHDCKQFSTHPISYPSGKCKLYNIGCGEGLYCNDYDKRA